MYLQATIDRGKIASAERPPVVGAGVAAGVGVVGGETTDPDVAASSLELGTHCQYQAL